MIEPVYAEIRSLEWPFAPENKSRKKKFVSKILNWKGIGTLTRACKL